MLDTAPESSPIDALGDYLDRWASARLSCEPADRPAAEEGIRLAYTTARLAPPARIVWCGGPLEIAASLAAASPGDIIGANVKAQIFDQVQKRVGTFAEVFWKEVIVGATTLSRDRKVGAAVEGYDKCKAVSAAINRIVRSDANDVLSGLRVRARHAARRLCGLPRLLPRWSFEEVAVGPHDLASLGVYEFLHDVLAWKEPAQPLRGLWKIAKSAGWMVPHEHVCWISERPSQICTDTRGRLHCPQGPALRYPDGWCAFAWKGVQVPAWMIEHPELITVAGISDTFEPVRRNCMIEIMTPERFVANGGASRVAEDEMGILWRKFWGYRGVTVGSWSAVEVADGTPDGEGSRKRFFLRVPANVRTAREAVAWTYGLTADQYVGLELRT